MLPPAATITEPCATSTAARVPITRRLPLAVITRALVATTAISGPPFCDWMKIGGLGPEHQVVKSGVPLVSSTAAQSMVVVAPAAVGSIIVGSKLLGVYGKSSQLPSATPQPHVPGATLSPSAGQPSSQSLVP